MVFREIIKVLSFHIVFKMMFKHILVYFFILIFKFVIIVVFLVMGHPIKSVLSVLMNKLQIELQMHKLINVLVKTNIKMLAI